MAAEKKKKRQQKTNLERRNNQKKLDVCYIKLTLSYNVGEFKMNEYTLVSAVLLILNIFSGMSNVLGAG